MVIICFPDGKDWYKANWVFWQLASDILAAYPDDVELRLSVQRAQANHGLLLDQMDPECASRIAGALRAVAEATLAGSIPGWRREHPDDEEGQCMYLRSMSELLDAASGGQTRA